MPVILPATARRLWLGEEKTELTNRSASSDHPAELMRTYPDHEPPQKNDPELLTLPGLKGVDPAETGLENPPMNGANTKSVSQKLRSSITDARDRFRNREEPFGIGGSNRSIWPPTCRSQYRS
jgi:hypothetical protein